MSRRRAARTPFSRVRVDFSFFRIGDEGVLQRESISAIGNHRDLDVADFVAIENSGACLSATGAAALTGMEGNSGVWRRALRLRRVRVVVSIPWRFSSRLYDGDHCAGFPASRRLSRPYMVHGGVRGVNTAAGGLFPGMTCSDRTPQPFHDLRDHVAEQQQRRRPPDQRRCEIGDFESASMASRISRQRAAPRPAAVRKIVR